MFRRLYFSFARQPKKIASTPKVSDADDIQKQLDRNSNMDKLIKFMDPKTSKLLDKYIDSFDTHTFTGMMQQVQKDLLSENSKFKLLSEQAKKNKDLQDLFKGETEFVNKLKSAAKDLQEMFESDTKKKKK